MKRLKTILKYIDNKDIVADIGCDHGYLIKMAINDKNILKAYAIDNKNAPLNSAINNLKNYKNVDFILSDGLKNVTVNDINCVVIAGMGGMLINSIILDSINKFKCINKIILCPNRNIDKVRMFLNDNGFKIINEDIVYEDSKYYEILVVKLGYQKLTEKELYFGPFLMNEKSKIIKNKWNEYYNKICNIKNKENEIKLIKEVMNEN